MSDGNRAMDDIAFMRALAQEGQASPLRSGPVLLAAGLIFGTTSAGAWAASANRLIVSVWTYPAIYLAASISFMLVLRALKMRGTAGWNSTANRVSGIAWSGIGAAIWTMAIALMLMGLHTGDWRVMAAFPSVVFALYGAAWMIAAAISRTGWLWLVTVASFGLSLAQGWFSTDAGTLYGLFTLGIFAVVAAPGLLLTLQARRA